MAATTTHFKVDNGDMHLLKTSDGKAILVDCNIRADADDPEGDAADVAKQLRERLRRDSSGRLYVDAFLLTHPDQDHCRGLERHFHLGPLADWSSKDDKIVIREMWSSPIVFRRASKNHTLCSDAKAWAKEARRRVAVFRNTYTALDGERILILGEDIAGKTDDLGAILVKTGGVFQNICGLYQFDFSARLLAPLPPQGDDEEEELSKNDSSVVLNIALKSSLLGEDSNILLGGDARVGIWERLWERHRETPEYFRYDVLVAPHHCSWRSLSWDSWSDLGESAAVSEDARSALGQPRSGAFVVASSKAVEDDDFDPPCIRAKREYVSILKGVKGIFECLGELEGDEPLEFEIISGGVRKKTRTVKVAATVISGLAGAASGSSAAYGSQPFRHG